MLETGELPGWKHPFVQEFTRQWLHLGFVGCEGPRHHTWFSLLEIKLNKSDNLKRGHFISGSHNSICLLCLLLSVAQIFLQRAKTNTHRVFPKRGVGLVYLVTVEVVVVVVLMLRVLSMVCVFSVCLVCVCLVCVCVLSVCVCVCVCYVS